MEATSTERTRATEPHFRDVATSSTFVYRFNRSTYDRVVDALQHCEQLGALQQPAADDFKMMSTSVLGELADRSVARRQLSLDLAVDPGQPIFEHAHPRPIVIVSTCSAERTVGVTINFVLDCADTDQLVAIAQSMYGRPSTMPILRDGPFPELDSQEQSIQRLQCAIAERLSIRDYQARNHFRCVEIRGVGDAHAVSEAVKGRELQLYGILTADEGWRHASRELAEVRLADAWSTREFVGIVGVGETALMINLRPDGYGPSQNGYFSRFFGYTEPYFSHRYHLAGLEHGQFLAQELCAYRQCVVDDLQRRLADRRASKMSVSLLGSIREQARRTSLYRSLLEDLFRLRDHPPTELNALVIAVEATSGLPQRLATLRQEVRAVETEDQSVYLYIVNRILVRATWIGVFVAVVGAAVAIAAALK